jgi:hypothetical protein
MTQHVRIMPLKLATENVMPGYAGALDATRHPQLANRFHFWRGASSRRYACTLFPVNAAPSYDDAIALFVRRGRSGPVLVSVGAGIDTSSAPPDVDEIHVHLVQGGADALAFVLRDLSALVAADDSLAGVQLRAA